MFTNTMTANRASAGRKWKWSLLILATVTLLIPTTCTAEPSSLADSTLAVSTPSGAIAYAEVSSLADILGEIENSAYLDLVTASSQFRGFEKSEAYRKAQAVRQIVETQIGMDLWTAGRKLLGGRLAVAVYPNPGERRPNVLALLDDADPAVLARLRERIEPFLVLAEGQVDVSEPIEGTQVIAVAGQLYVAVGDDWVAAASGRELMTRAVELHSGKSGDSLAKDESFQTMIRQMGHDHLAYVFVDSEALYQATNGKPIPEKLDNALVALLVGGILDLAADSPYAGLSLDVEEHRFVLKAGIAGDTRQLDDVHQAFFSDPAGPGTPAIPQVPELIGGFTIHRDVCQLYRQREQLLQEKALPGFDKFETGLSNLLPGKDFGEDVLPLIGKHFTLVAAQQTYDHLDGEPGVKLPGFGFIVELAEPREAADLFQLFFQTFSSILNIQAAQQGRQPWVMSSETYNDVQISYGRYLEKPSGERLPLVFNFMPASARVDDKYIISSSLELCRQLVDHLREPAASSTGANRNLNFEFNFAPFTQILEANQGFFKARAIQQGRAAEQAAADFVTLVDLLRSLDSARFSTSIKPDAFQIQLEGYWK